MKILLLAPQPFYQERGTPIAVGNLLRILSERGDQVDVLAYHEGVDVYYRNVTINRIPALPFVRGVRPGFSWKKLLCDTLMVTQAALLIVRGKYDLIHAIEEGSIMAFILKRLFGVPYVYDMDSSLRQQLVDKYPHITIAGRLLTWFERTAVRNAEAVLPVCDALAEEISELGPKRVTVLHDVSLLTDREARLEQSLLPKDETAGLTLMYVGNLEAYQGIDLLLESFAIALHHVDTADLVIIGGRDSDIQKYQRKSHWLGVAEKVHFLGPKPTNQLATYLAQADILVSPRIKGNNTPMKLYSYLHSGKAVLATNLPTHTQVLDSRVAVLAEPTPEGYALGITKLLQKAALRDELGRAGKSLIEERHTFPVLRAKVNELYDWLDQRSAKAVPTG